MFQIFEEMTSVMKICINKEKPWVTEPFCETGSSKFEGSGN